MNTKSVSKMTEEERKDLMQKLAEVVKNHGLEKEVKVERTRETVCALAANEIQDDQSISISKVFTLEMKEKADAFKLDLEELTKNIDGVKVDIKCQVGVGSQYDPIKDIVPVSGGEPMTLEHVEGEVWLIDFWATWCPPCQAPMQHNEDMLKKRAKDWGDNVKIIGISIDKTAEVVVKHVDSKDWNRPIHYHKAGSNCSEVYGVRGVPHVMLLDTKGKIVFKGHPATRKDLEADFDTLLKGEVITGDGTGVEKKEDPATADSGKVIDPAASMEYIDKFASDLGPALQKNEEIKQVAKQMPRAFCVMVFTEKLDCETGRTKAEWQNYRVLVGKQDAIDTCKQVLEANIEDKGYEVVLREQAI